MTATRSHSPNEDQVRQIAHSLWVDEGMPEGRAEYHWYKALQLAAVDTGTPAPEAVSAVAKPKARNKVAAAKKAGPVRRSKS